MRRWWWMGAIAFGLGTVMVCAAEGTLDWWAAGLMGGALALLGFGAGSQSGYADGFAVGQAVGNVEGWADGRAFGFLQGRAERAGVAPRPLVPGVLMEQIATALANEDGIDFNATPVVEQRVEAHDDDVHVKWDWPGGGVR